MKIENQCVNLELSKQLKEAGAPQESVFYWAWYKQRHDPLWEVVNRRTDEAEYSAFTVSELGEMLKCDKQIFTNYVEDEDDWVCLCRNWDGDILMTNNADTEANARAKMLLYLIQNGLLSIKE